MYSYIICDIEEENYYKVKNAYKWELEREIKKWCDKNIIDQWYIKYDNALNNNKVNKWVFYFKNKDDAIRFKLMWAE